MLIGETGAGKSYLGNAMLGEKNPNLCICENEFITRRNRRYPKRKSMCCPFEAAEAGDVECKLCECLFKIKLNIYYF